MCSHSTITSGPVISPCARTKIKSPSMRMRCLPIGCHVSIASSYRTFPSAVEVRSCSAAQPLARTALCTQVPRGGKPRCSTACLSPLRTRRSAIRAGARVHRRTPGGRGYGDDSPPYPRQPPLAQRRPRAVAALPAAARLATTPIAGNAVGLRHRIKVLLIAKQGSSTPDGSRLLVSSPLA